MRQGLAACQATGAEILRPYFLALLAEAYGKVGQAEEGLTALAEALALVDKSGERFYEAELYRLKGAADAAEFQASPESRAKSQASQGKSQVGPKRSGGVFPQGHRDCAQATGEVAGTARGDEPRPAAATASDAARITYHAPRSTHQTRRSSPDVIRDLQLVH